MKSVKVVNFAGKVKAWQQRLATYIAMLSFLMVFYLYIIESPFNLEWYHWLVIVVLCVVSVLYLDIKFILPASQEYMTEKNPFFVKMRDDIKEIKVHLGIEEGG